MLLIEELEITEEMVLNKGKFILADIRPTYARDEDNNAILTKQIGTSLVVAMTGRRLEKIVVTIDEIVPCKPFEQLELAEISFVNFKGYFHKKNETEEYQFEATASQFKLASN